MDNLMPNSPSVHADEFLEFAITDFCNLRCPFCSQGSPIQQDRKQMSFEQFAYYASLIRNDEFHTIKLSGGEPTLHKKFREFTLALPSLFPNKKYILATNGAALEKYIDILDIYAQVDLTLYPKEKQPYIGRLYNILKDRPNIFFSIKYNDESELPAGTLEQAKDLVELFPMDHTDIFPNAGKKDVYQKCGLRKVRKVVQERIYSCCVAFGLCEIRDNLIREDVSVPFDANWREGLAAIDATMNTVACEKCFINPQ